MRAGARTWPEWIEWKPGRVWCYDLTHFTRAHRVAVAVLDVVSRRWLSALVSAEETSTQIEARPGSSRWFGHVKGHWPHLEKIRDPGELTAELDRVRIEYNTLRLHAGIG